MVEKKGLICLGLFLVCLIVPQKINAQTTGCSDRYLTLINPVRGRNLWFDNSIKPLNDQYLAISKYGFSATWLLQHDALADKEIVNYIKTNFTNNQESGLFLEISPDLARSARVIYPPLTPWFYPRAVFLSGYTQSERRRLIDTVFFKYNEVFGDHPTSVGAWWIDSYSLEYLKNRYDIKTVLIVADQKTTDNYGIWGQWWGTPYYPSSANVLTPASTENSKLDVVLLQWAQRDVTKAYGEGKSFSNNSLQANDYTERKLDTSYFSLLVESYLDCGLPIGQITVGLETGMEAVMAFPEYKKQLEVLSKIEGLQSVTMNEFSDRYRERFRLNPAKITLKDDTSEWVMTTRERENKYLGDKIVYRDNLAFTDYFTADRAEYLDRKLPITKNGSAFISPLFIFLAFVLGFVLYRFYRLTGYFWYVSVFILATYLTTFMDYAKYGRVVYFGPLVKNIAISQFGLTVVSFVIFIPILKLLMKYVRNLKVLLLCLPLAYAIDFLVSILRYTKLHDQHYLGFAWDPLRFIGIRFSQNNLAIINQDFPSIIANALLKFDFSNIWSNQLVGLIVYPLIHLVLGVLIYLVINRLPKNLRYFCLTVLTVFFCLYIYSTINLDPRMVL